MSVQKHSRRAARVRAYANPRTFPSRTLRRLATMSSSLRPLIHIHIGFRFRTSVIFRVFWALETVLHKGGLWHSGFVDEED